MELAEIEALVREHTKDGWDDDIPRLSRVLHAAWVRDRVELLECWEEDLNGRGKAEARVTKLEARLAALAQALDFSVGAISDAIYTEDGLDGSAGEAILMILAEAKKYGTFDQRKVSRAEMLEILALAADEEGKE